MSRSSYVWVDACLLSILFLVIGVSCQDAAGSSEVIRGVNLGGWLVTEPWISPSLYSSGADDEWSLCNGLGKRSCSSVLQSHWESFFTRDDIVDIKAAGLNSLRIPVGYWAVDVTDFEPYVTGQYPYLIRAVNWARELGLTVLIDLHGAPGSQNGQDNSGLIGPVLFQTNTSNGDRSLNVLRNLTEEFSRDIYGGVVTGIELLNEPRLSSMGFTMGQLTSFYTAGSSVIRAASNTVNVTFHVGEWSLETGTAPNTTSSRQNRDNGQAKRTWMRLMFEAQLAAYSPNGPGQRSIGWYYWTWKTEYDIDTWSYRRGVEQGYIPSDVSNSSTLAFPRLANGCVDSNFNYTAPARPGRTSAATPARPCTVGAPITSILGVLAIFVL
ncbi:hypothetical protein IAR55_003730 [Kwoniella newhampshirensis]|uniref:Glycoside hydrolase family 5 domain-containing protein n=1 Tax=Kwoniella newhampshirensis TaxID=1651941 RepID=A0AAW0YY57_9TREE